MRDPTPKHPPISGWDLRGVEMSAPAVQSACAYCGKEHAHDLICGEMFVTHAQVLSRKDREMSTDTPRTDAITTHWNLSLHDMNDKGRHLLKLARQLERELASCADERKARKEAEHDWRTWGIIEIAVRNSNVADYVRHWEQRAEAAEAELARINPLYTAACIRARDAEQRAEVAVASWDEERQRAEREGKRVVDLTERLAQIEAAGDAMEHAMDYGDESECLATGNRWRALRTAAPQEQTIIGADPASKDGDYACEVNGRIEGSNIIIEEINYSSAAPASQYAAGLGEWAELHQGEKK